MNQKYLSFGFVSDICIPFLYESSVHILESSFYITDFVMLGYLGQGYLASLILGQAIFSLVYHFISGFILTTQCILIQDTINHFFQPNQTVIVVTSLSILWSTGLCSMGSLLFLISNIIFSNIMQIKEKISHKASEYLMILIPTLWASIFFQLFSNILSYQDSGIRKQWFKPIILLIGSCLNILLDYFLVYHYGLGFIGCSLATSLSHISMILLLYLYIQLYRQDVFIEIVNEVSEIILSTEFGGNSSIQYFISIITNIPTSSMKSSRNQNQSNRNRNRIQPISPDIDEDVDLNEGIESSPLLSSQPTIPSSNIQNSNVPITAPAFSSSSFPNTSQLIVLTSNHSLSIDSSLIYRRFLVIGFNGAIQECVNEWFFVVMDLTIIYLGSIPLDAHATIIIMTRCIYSFFPAVVTTTMITYLQSDQLIHQNIFYTKLVFYSILLLVLIYHIIVGIFIHYFGTRIGFLVTNSNDIAYRISQLTTIGAAFQLAYGIQKSCSLILDIVKKKGISIGLNLLGFWLIGLPAGYILCFIARPTLGLEGYWIGISTGMGLVTLVKLYLVLFIDWTKETWKAEESNDQRNGESILNPIHSTQSTRHRYESLLLDFMESEEL